MVFHLNQTVSQIIKMFAKLFNYHAIYNWLTLSQTSPGFYVSAVEAFWKHCGERRNCLLRAITPLPAVFSTRLESFLLFSSISKVSSANSFNLGGVKFVVWERVKATRTLTVWSTKGQVQGYPVTLTLQRLIWKLIITSRDECLCKIWWSQLYSVSNYHPDNVWSTKGQVQGHDVTLTFNGLNWKSIGIIYIPRWMSAPNLVILALFCVKLSSGQGLVYGPTD